MQLYDCKKLYFSLVEFHWYSVASFLGLSSAALVLQDSTIVNTKIPDFKLIQLNKLSKGKLR